METGGNDILAPSTYLLSAYILDTFKAFVVFNWNFMAITKAAMPMVLVLQLLSIQKLFHFFDYVQMTHK